MDLIFVPLNIKRLLYLVVVILIALLINRFFLSNFPQAQWFLYVACWLALLITYNFFVTQWWLTIFAIGLCALLVFVSGLLAGSLLLLTLWLFFITFLNLSLKQRQHFYLHLFLNVFVIIAVSVSVSWQENISRSMWVTFGGAIAISVGMPFLYRAFYERQQAGIINYLHSLVRLNTEIFACYQKNYPDALYLYEHRIHIQKVKCLNVFDQLRRANVNKAKANTEFLDHLDQLFNLVISCGALRWRVSDASIFEICEQEMASLAQQINQALLHFNPDIKEQSNNFTVEALEEKIKQFEALFYRVLQVTAKEPFVFLMFIYDLFELQKQLYMSHAVLRKTV